jgi:hypothetical protein
MAPPSPIEGETWEAHLPLSSASDTRFVARLLITSLKGGSPNLEFAPARSSHYHPRLPLPVLLEPYHRAVLLVAPYLLAMFHFNLAALHLAGPKWATEALKKKTGPVRAY